MRSVHILAGTAVLVAGFVALYAPKGGPLHRLAGRVFIAAMLAMALLGSTMALVTITDRGTALVGMLCVYLVLSGYLAVARDYERSRPAIQWLAVGAASIAGIGLALGVPALARGVKVDHLPAVPVVVFAGFALLGAMGDARVLWRGSLAGRARVYRHLWRMGLALWIATSSFFLGQAKFLPAIVREHGVHGLPVIAVLLTTLYWVVRVRWWTPRRRQPVAPS